MSPTLFNMNMDTYVDQLRTEKKRKNEPRGPGESWDTTLFADNVRL